MNRENLEKSYSFFLEMEVRDYELDCEKIVNNANYLHYFEHTRHKFCQFVGVPFISLVEKGIVVVVRKIEIEYLSSLHSGETFLSCLWLERKGPRFIFHQDIISAEYNLIARAIVTVVSLENGKLTRGDEISEIFSEYIKST